MSAATLAGQRAQDAESRSLAQREFARPVAIEAGAGTGKTATLVARVLAWCLGPGWERALAETPDAHAARIAERVLRGVVAITFTEAAAAEMDGRIDAALAQLASGEAPDGFDLEAPRERVAALRGALDQLVVQTIHAYCRRLLAAHPLEAGLHPRFEVDADGRACAMAVRETVAEQLGAAYARRDEAALELAAQGVGPREFEEAIVALLGAGASAEELARDPLAPEAIEALRARLAAAHEALADAADGRLALVKGRSNKALEAAAALDTGLAALAEPAPDAEALARLRERLLGPWDESVRNALERFARGKFGKAEEKALGDRADAVQEAAGALAPLLKHLEKVDPAALSRIAPWLASLADGALERMRRRGSVSFEMLLTRAAALLEAHPETAASLRRGIDQLLVDEFQDTDPRQCRIVGALALEGPLSERPGLFLVGDPKQSIYGWRNADLEAYEGMLGRLREAGGVVHALCVNYRSVPAVLAEVERVVRPVMRREAGLQPAFEALAPCEKLEAEPGFAAGAHAAIEHWVSAESDAAGALRSTRGAESAALEARALARDLRSLHDAHGVAWRDIGVLFRSRGEWDVYLGALRQANVPFEVEGDRTYYRRREILDAAALVAAILDRNDAIALVTLLRSSIAGVPDAAWIPLWEGGLPALAARLGDDAGALDEIAPLLERTAEAIADVPGVERVAGWHVAARACLEHLDVLRRSFARDPADLFVERVRESLCFELTEAARFLGPWRAANLERFFGDLAADLAAGEPPAMVLRRIRIAVAEDETPSAEPATPVARDAVRVVTLHGAKGLAWEHVYLMQLHKGEAGPQVKSDAGRISGALEALWCGTPTLGYDRVLARRRAVSEAERVRTLYVGMTRARRRLVLCGVRPQYQEQKRESHVTLLESRGPEAPDLDALARAAAANGGHSDGAHARWVFPALWAEPPPPEVAVASPSPSVDVERAPVLAAAPFPDAALRMALPRGLSVSALAASIAPDAAPGESAASEAATPGGAPPAARAAASAAGRVVGTAVHAALERLDLAGAREGQWAAQRVRIEAEVRGAAPAAVAARAAEDALACWDALGEGPLAARLFALVERVIARELPLLLPPGDAGAIGFVSGAIDLLYRDADDRLVVVDYKTDRVPHEPGSEARERYLRQGALYCRAVGEALGATAAPRFEIWWLRHGAVDRVESAPLAPGPSQLSLTL